MKTGAVHGVAMVLGAAALWGTTGTAQSLLPGQLSSYWVGAMRLGVAALFFLPWVLYLGGRRSTSPVGTMPWPGIVAAAVCMCTYNLAFFAGVRVTGVAVGTAVALGSGPVWAGVLQSIAGRRAQGGLWWAGIGVAVCGVALMVARGGPANDVSPFGIGMCLLAGLSYAGYALVNKGLVARIPSWRATAAVFVFAAAMALPAAWVLAGHPTLGSGEIAVVAWLGVMSTGVAYLLFSQALRHISGATAVALALAEPMVAFGLAIAVVGERPGSLAFVGLLAVLTGLVAVVGAEVAAAARDRRLAEPGGESAAWGSGSGLG